jgi:hypothetical protein
MEGEAVDDLMPDPEATEVGPIYEEGEQENLFFLCDRSDQQLEGIAMEAWEETVESQVCKTCLAIRARAWAGTLTNLSDRKKQQILREMQKFKDNDDWTLDPKHVYRRSILRQKAPSWAESTEKIERHYRPIWNPEQLREQWREPNDGDYWAFPKSQFSDGSKIEKEFIEFMTDPKNIGMNLRKKNNLSALGLDGIGYLMMKVGKVPMLQHIANLFGSCSQHAQVPTTWKRPRTIFLYKKGEVSDPTNWRPITITSCVYRIFTSMISELVQQHIHKCGRRNIFSASQKCFVMGIQGCMEHAQRYKKNLFMVQIDFSNAFGSVPQKMIDWNMRRTGIPDLRWL